MNRDEIFSTVSRTMSEMFEIEPERITPDARLFEDLDLDSIDAIDMAVKMQEMTGRKVEEAALRRLRTVADVVGMLEEILGSR